MPRARKGLVGLSTQLPADVYEGMKALAGELGRPLSAEVEHAIRRHLAAPPSPPAGLAILDETADVSREGFDAIADAPVRPRVIPWGV
jgi:hypothetical protein